MDSETIIESSFEYTDGKMYRTIKMTMPPCDTNDDAAWAERNDLAERIRALLQAPAQPAQVQGWQWVPVNWNELLERVRLTDDESKHHGRGATYWNNAVFACRMALRDALAASPQPPVQEPVKATAELEQVQGWSLVKVNGAFKTLVRALDRADRKGYLADALIEPWEEFDYAYVYAAAPQSSDDFPGMWHESDLSGGATDCVQPSDDVAKDAWIPVGERLPEYGQEVIVNTDFEGVCAGVLDSYGEWFAPCSEYKLTRITHWMPLPAAPGAAPSAPKDDDPVKQMMLEALEMLETTCELGLGYDHAIRQVARAAIAAARQEGGNESDI